jgi:hypothetical protein
VNAQVKEVKKAARSVRLTKTAVMVNGVLSHLALTFADGTTRTVEVPPAVREQAIAYGALSKIGGLTSKEQTLDELKAEVEALVERWSDGEWAERSEGGQGTSIIQKALMEARGKSANEVAEFLKTKTMAQKVEMKSLPMLAPIVARLEAEEAAKAAQRAAAKGKAAPDESLLEGL